MLRLPLKVSAKLECSGFIDLSTIIFNRSIYYILVLIIVIIVVWITIKLPQNNDLLILSLLIISSLLIVYHRRYDFCILFIPMGYFLQDMAARRTARKKIKLIFESLCLLGIYFVFFDDTVIKKLGIHFVVGAEYSNIYLAICRSLVFVSWFVLMITCLRKIQQEKENRNQIL